MDEMRISARRGENGNFEFDSYDAEGLFTQATALLHEGRCDEAVVLYDRVKTEFRSSGYYSPSLYNAGLCLEDKNQLDRSAVYFRELIANVPDTAENPDVRHAQFMLSNVLVRLSLWDEAIEIATRLLAREDLDSDERMEAMTRKAQAQFGANRFDEAERESRAALTFFRTRPDDARVLEDFYVGAANFVLAEVLRSRADAIELPEGTPEAQHEVLERRARLVLSAQTEYFNTIRHGNAHWAGAAGYRVGAVYDSFWAAITRAPVPPRPDLSAANYAMFSEEYRSSLRQMIRPLLQHAVRYWEMTLMMMERTGVRSEWESQIRADLERVRSRLVESPVDVSAAPAAPTAPP
jgi:hypothetical protein